MNVFLFLTQRNVGGSRIRLGGVARLFATTANKAPSTIENYQVDYDGILPFYVNLFLFIALLSKKKISIIFNKKME